MQSEIDKMKRLGTMIRRARCDKRLTTYQVSQVVGCTPSEVSAVENGEKWPDEVIWENLAIFVGLPVDMLSSVRNPKKGPPQEQPKEFDKQPKTTNVVSFAVYHQKKWQQTSLLDKD